MRSLVWELVGLPVETGWVEFKLNKAVPEDMGEYISALSNTAALQGRAKACMVWGVEDGSHRLVGTTFIPFLEKVGNQELESWLLMHLEPRLHFSFHTLVLDEVAVVVLEIDAAFRHPVKFKGAGWIRVGSYKKRLHELPEIERALWRQLDQTPFEFQVATEKQDAQQVLRLLDYPSYFRLLNHPLPDVGMYPDLAIRELVANALIHQDLNVSGAGPMIEIFSNRLEVTNPGTPLMDTQRLLDCPPRSRNEALASLMRRMQMCEERGTGVDKVVSSCELHPLPAPSFDKVEGSTRATLYALRPLTRMDTEDRIRAVYWHACLRHVCGQHTHNASIRERFGIADRNSAMASRLLKDAEAAAVIRAFDEQAAPKQRRYVPFWA